MNSYLKAPVSLQVELTEDCNNQCQHCYNFFRYEGERMAQSKPIGMSRLFEIADNIIRNEVFHVTLSGGEPLLIGEENLKKIISHYRKSEVMVGLNSNLSLLSDYLIGFFVDSDVTILTSIPHYDKDRFNKIVNNDSYEKTVSSIEKIVCRGGHIYANMVVTKETINDVYTTGEFVAGLGCSGFCATRITPVNLESAIYQKDLVLDNQDIVDLLEQLLEVEKKRHLQIATLNPLPFCAVSDVRKYEKLLVRRCCAGITSAGVGINGELRGCQHLPQEYGNLFKEELKDIWKRVPAWREEYERPDCLGCVEIEKCAGGCRENALVMCGNINGPDNLMRDGFGPLVESVLDMKDEEINSLKLRDGILIRNESFGGILFLNPAAYTLVDNFVFNLIPFYSDKIISKTEWLKVGSGYNFINWEYLNKTFNDLIHKGLATKIN